MLTVDVISNLYANLEEHMKCSSGYQRVKTYRTLFFYLVTVVPSDACAKANPLGKSGLQILC